MCVIKLHAFIYFLRPPPWSGTVITYFSEIFFTRRAPIQVRIKTVLTVPTLSCYPYLVPAICCYSVLLPKLYCYPVILTLDVTFSLWSPSAVVLFCAYSLLLSCPCAFCSHPSSKSNNKHIMYISHVVYFYLAHTQKLCTTCYKCREYIWGRKDRRTVRFAYLGN